MSVVENSSPRLLRYRLVESIVPLAADPADLVVYAHARGWDVDEVVRDFVDWTSEFIPALLFEGVIPLDLAEALRLLCDRAVEAMDSAPYEECETAVLDPLWSEMRVIAQAIVERFRELSVPIPAVGQHLLGDVSTVPLDQR